MVHCRWRWDPHTKFIKLARGVRKVTTGIFHPARSATDSSDDLALESVRSCELRNSSRISRLELRIETGSKQGQGSSQISRLELRITQLRSELDWQKASSPLRTSQAVPHPSTDRALRCLTSEFRWDRVHSSQYGRWRRMFFS